MKTKPFNLEEYLANPSMRVVTRRGYTVRIICTNRKHTQNWPIVALESCYDGEFVLYANDKGKTDLVNENIHDLFFVDEEEDELTEFEKRFIEIVDSWCMDDGRVYEESPNGYKCAIKDAKELLGIARKELQNEFQSVVTTEAYNEGREDALKEMPKWKKFTCGIAGNCERDVFLIRNYDGTYYTSQVLSSDCEYIELRELENLPKS